ncbi:hypothetical protein VOLCADRAFT_108178 [Volvox carteri f. nagariensis]|uniref:HAT C-terminal dimerisation domain-containing protein n=1 Tax=Volvox carteri f. nagariensis TaxID=3068 RepID=D8UIS4_VOLCA|nr:uncharacterized protein VOLCADRAFT_108178 [Volvox carteri f. nagariensis]EFJ40370.1 hypothetical protein VOLCADRAFT_108178 [Volvox carteri f. nagariensis]|eukprot:XP_002958574.1 hypothetical protein VOLCADRAFT_108178 [Volvox carteri f. nagariensis]
MPTLTARKEVEQTVGKSKVKKVELAGLPLRLKFWTVHMADSYPALAFVANRVLRMHATTCASERNWSLWGNLFHKAHNRLGQMRAMKLIFIRQNDSYAAKRNTLSDEEVVMQLLAGEEEE